MSTRIEQAVPEQLKAFEHAKSFRATLAAGAYCREDEAKKSRLEWMKTIEQDRKRAALVEREREERASILAEERRLAELAAAVAHVALLSVGVVPAILKVPVRAIQEITARYFKISIIDLISDRRAANLVRARHVAIFLAKEMLPWSLPKIGRAFGKRDHTTVLHAVRRIGDACRQDPSFTAEVDVIRSQILVAATRSPSPLIAGTKA